MISALILALSGYVCWHLWRITPQGWKLAVVGVFVLWIASLFVGYAINDRIPMGAASALYEVGNTWLVAFAIVIHCGRCGFALPYYSEDNPQGKHRRTGNRSWNNGCGFNPGRHPLSS